MLESLKRREQEPHHGGTEYRIDVLVVGVEACHAGRRLYQQNLRSTIVLRAVGAEVEMVHLTCFEGCRSSMCGGHDGFSSVAGIGVALWVGINGSVAVVCRPRVHRSRSWVAPGRLAAAGFRGLMQRLRRHGIEEASQLPLSA